MPLPITGPFSFPDKLPTPAQLQDLTEDKFLEYGSVLQKIDWFKGEPAESDLIEKWRQSCDAWYNEAAYRGYNA